MTETERKNLFYLIDYALEEFGDYKKHSEELCNNSYEHLSLDNISADVSLVEVKRDKIYLRKYDVQINGSHFISFLLGPTAFLFSGLSRKYREELIDSNTVKGIITLKRSILSQPVIPMSVIILGERNHKIWFTTVDNKRLLVDLFTGIMSKRLVIYYSDKLYADSFMPEYYNGDKKDIEDSFNGCRTTELVDIAEIINGRGPKSEDISDKGVPCLRGRDLCKGRIQKTEYYIGSKNAIKYSKALLQEGDILLTKNFGQNKLALVTADDLPAIASSGLIIIRAFGVAERYLYNYLTSETGNEVFNKQVKRIQRGTVISSISLEDLKHILVPVFDNETMAAIVGDMPSATTELTIETANTLLKCSTYEGNIVQKVYDDLLKAGWQAELFITEAIISVDSEVKWKPDLLYKYDDEMIIYFEIITDLLKIDAAVIKGIMRILDSKQKSIVVISNGNYYEIHSSLYTETIKMKKTPAICDIQNWKEA